MNSSTTGRGGSAADDPLVPYYSTVNSILGLSRSTAEKIAARGEIPTIRVGKLVKCRETAIRDFIAKAEAQTIADRRVA